MTVPYLNHPFKQSYYFVKCKINFFLLSGKLLISPIFFSHSTRAVAPEHLVGRDSRRRTVSAPWTRDPHARKTILPVTQKVKKTIRCEVSNTAACIQLAPVSHFDTRWLCLQASLALIKVHILVRMFTHAVAGGISPVYTFNQRTVAVPGTICSQWWKHLGVGAQPCYFSSKRAFSPRGELLFFSICVASPCLSVLTLASHHHTYLYANICAPSNVPQWEM